MTWSTGRAPKRTAVTLQARLPQLLSKLRGKAPHAEFPSLFPLTPLSRFQREPVLCWHKEKPLPPPWSCPAAWFATLKGILGATLPYLVNKDTGSLEESNEVRISTSRWYTGKADKCAEARIRDSTLRDICWSFTQQVTNLAGKKELS